MLDIRGIKYALAFVLLSGIDAFTTLFGIKHGFSEANPVLRAGLSDPAAFLARYAAYTLIGASLILVSFNLRGKPFRYLGRLMVVLKALPVLSNTLLLVGL
ncbi:DUF5658 family protein [Thermococcus sp.]|uniref:DUF5658 family protein n=1 Tax=Thermococcus sp. TaxID=35749 RepID=UPI0026240707|nr:DUF5658 family protein [Thermococcus sp.]